MMMVAGCGPVFDGGEEDGFRLDVSRLDVEGLN